MSTESDLEKREAIVKTAEIFYAAQISRPDLLEELYNKEEYRDKKIGEVLFDIAIRTAKDFHKRADEYILNGYTE